MIQSTLLYVRKNIRELLIHMICGASQSDILLRISAEVLIINLVSVDVYKRQILFGSQAPPKFRRRYFIPVYSFIMA